MTPRARIALFGVFGTLWWVNLGASCGQQGPLFLPDDPDQPPDQPLNQPAAGSTPTSGSRNIPAISAPGVEGKTSGDRRQ
ncbi:MAG: hypothetical protein AAF918_02110 [Pseudomonadota bacterium]